MKNTIFKTLLFCFICFSSLSQSILINETQTPTQLINNLLLGFGVTASNITINGNPLNANSPIANLTS
ncbi:MAG: hypothetical protein FJX84_09695, partial [Bacteroidetes bacterium]|nr:hypothetical protein [Bacteroidota bacterium]